MNSIWAKDRAWTFYSVVSGFLECWNNKKPTKILIVARFLPMYFRIPNCHKINHDWVNLFEILLDLNISCWQQSVFTIAIHSPWSSSPPGWSKKRLVNGLCFMLLPFLYSSFVKLLDDYILSHYKTSIYWTDKLHLLLLVLKFHLHHTFSCQP